MSDREREKKREELHAKVGERRREREVRKMTNMEGYFMRRSPNLSGLKVET